MFFYYMGIFFIVLVIIGTFFAVYDYVTECIKSNADRKRRKEEVESEELHEFCVNLAQVHYQFYYGNAITLVKTDAKLINDKMFFKNPFTSNWEAMYRAGIIAAYDKKGKQLAIPAKWSEDNDS